MCTVTPSFWRLVRPALASHRQLIADIWPRFLIGNTIPTQQLGVPNTRQRMVRERGAHVHFVLVPEMRRVNHASGLKSLPLHTIVTVLSGGDAQQPHGLATEAICQPISKAVASACWTCDVRLRESNACGQV